MTILKVSRQIEIDYGHTLPNHFSFCNQFHGHRGIIIATVLGELASRQGDSNEGMVLDFIFLKKIMMTYIHDFLDHGFAVWEKDIKSLDFIKSRNNRYLITKLPPTAEYLAQWGFNQIKPHLPSNVKLESLTWYETPSNYAEYSYEHWLDEQGKQAK